VPAGAVIVGVAVGATSVDVAEGFGVFVRVAGASASVDVTLGGGSGVRVAEGRGNGVSVITSGTGVGLRTPPTIVVAVPAIESALESLKTYVSRIAATTVTRITPTIAPLMSACRKTFPIPSPGSPGMLSTLQCLLQEMPLSGIHPGHFVAQNSVAQAQGFIPVWMLVSIQTTCFTSETSHACTDALHPCATIVPDHLSARDIH